MQRARPPALSWGALAPADRLRWHRFILGGSAPPSPPVLQQSIPTYNAKNEYGEILQTIMSAGVLGPRWRNKKEKNVWGLRPNTCGANFRCVRHHGSSLTRLQRSWVQLLPNTDPKQPKPKTKMIMFPRGLTPAKITNPPDNQPPLMLSPTYTRHPPPLGSELRARHRPMRNCSVMCCIQAATVSLRPC